MLELFTGLFFLAALFVALLDIVILLGYGLFYTYRLINKSSVIKRASELPAGTLYTADNKSTAQAMENIVPILEFWEDLGASEFPCKVGDNLYNRITRSKNILHRAGLKRELRFLDARAEHTTKGDIYRKWDIGGKEWRASEITATMVESFVSLDGNVAVPAKVYYGVTVICSMSRKLRKSEKNMSHMKDKWGRPEYTGKFYEGTELEKCPSCGGDLPKDRKDAVCPYCGSTIFTDFFDWQIESLEIKPAKKRIIGVIGFVISSLKHEQIGAKVIDKSSPVFSFLVKNNKKKGKKGKAQKNKNKIHMFSENDFYADVYEECSNYFAEDGIIDMWMDSIVIKTVGYDHGNTIINAQIPIYKETIGDANEVLIGKNIENMRFARKSNPAKLDKNKSTITEERQCPSCGAGFEPDNNGNCKSCGTFLFYDELKWKRI